MAKVLNATKILERTKSARVEKGNELCIVDLYRTFRRSLTVKGCVITSVAITDLVQPEALHLSCKPNLLQLNRYDGVEACVLYFVDGGVEQVSV